MLNPKMKKQFFRVKQLADQTFSRAEKSDVLTEDMVVAEKRVELIRQSCHNVTKKVSACLKGASLDATTVEKRQKKMPEFQLAQVMAEMGATQGDTAMGCVMEEGGRLQGILGKELFSYEMDIEHSVLSPLQTILDEDIPSVVKLRKQLAKFTLDMDSVRFRHQAAIRHSQVSSSGSAINNKADTLQHELEEASSKVEQCRDNLATEMLYLMSRETEISQYIAHLFKIQAEYHKKSLEALESVIPVIDDRLASYTIRPVFGVPLDQHLEVSGREIAFVIEKCVYFFLQHGMDEEGLFRIPASASKVKKLKSSFDAGIVDLTEFIADPHTVAGTLKSYLRNLPEPLATHELYTEWMHALRASGHEIRLKSMWEVVNKLPQSNFDNLAFLMTFLYQLSLNHEVNKMTSQNIAIVFHPAIIWAPNEDSISMGVNMTLAASHTSLIDILVTYAYYFFPDVHFSEPSDEPKITSDINASFNSTEETVENSTYHDEAFEHGGIDSKSELGNPNEIKVSNETKPGLSTSLQEETIISSSAKRSFSEPSESISADSLDIPQNGANKQMESPRVPKRLNKKAAAPPIPSDGIKSCLERSMSSRNTGGNRVVVERAQSYVEKPVTKPPVVRKAEFVSPDAHGDKALSNSITMSKSDLSETSEEHCLTVGHRSPVSTVERVSSTKKTAQSPNNLLHSPVEGSVKSSGFDINCIRYVPEKRASLERPSSRPPPPPESIQDKSRSVLSESKKSGSLDLESVFDVDKGDETNVGKLYPVLNEEAPTMVSENDESPTRMFENSSHETAKIRNSGIDSPPERPPRSHSPNITTISEDKQFCTVIQLQGEPEKISSPSVKVKPARPPFPHLPPPIKPRPGSMPAKMNEPRDDAS